MENSLLVALSFVLNFSLVLDNAVTIRNKMQVVYKEMPCDGGKSYVVKWNLIGRIQFKHVKNCLMFM